MKGSNHTVSVAILGRSGAKDPQPTPEQLNEQYMGRFTQKPQTGRTNPDTGEFEWDD
jgi:hypothetical protein